MKDGHTDVQRLRGCLERLTAAGIEPTVHGRGPRREFLASGPSEHAVPSPEGVVSEN